MIYYNSNIINDWNFNSSNIKKVYYDGVVAYYWIGNGDASSQKSCFAVVNDISLYDGTEFPKVYDLSTSNWFFKNDIGQYEPYGVFGDGRDITTYLGKLTIDNGYEYEWDGTEWVVLGKVDGGTNSLPNVPFSVNYNARDYDASTHTIPRTDGQLVSFDAVITGSGVSQIVDHSDEGYITLPNDISQTTRAGISNSSNQQYFNRNEDSPNLTIITKARTTSECNIIVNRGDSYNWMYRQYSGHLTLHGVGETGRINVDSNVPNILSVRVNSSRTLLYNNYTKNTTSTPGEFSYGSQEDIAGGNLFSGYYNIGGEQWAGDFYWVYMTQNTLTDEQVQEVIDFNENTPVLPKKYEELEEPSNNLTFRTMEDALAYECPWVGMKATIGGTRYEYTENGWEELLQSKTVNLNEQWQTSTSYGNLSADTQDYEFYESFSNYNVANGKAIMYITIYGYTEFTFKVRSYGESDYDYVTVNKLDDMADYSWGGTTTNSNVYYYGKGKASNTVWDDVTFSGIDGGEHTIKITYGKDGSVNNNDDRGYVAIPINQ